jgi:hypothetical protein
MMNIISKVVFVLAALFLTTLPAIAEDSFAGSKVSSLGMGKNVPVEVSGSGTGGRAGNRDEQLVLRLSDFERFAKGKVQEFNRNHRFSRTRMQINKQPDGLYRAVYHQIDGASLTCNVSRSQSKSIPFVGVLSYQEQVFEGFGATPEECRRGSFSLVSVIPNRHIFSYSKGGWN